MWIYSVFKMPPMYSLRKQDRKKKIKMDIRIENAVLQITDTVILQWKFEDKIYLRQEPQGTSASKDRCFVHPLAASGKERERSTFKFQSKSYRTNLNWQTKKKGNKKYKPEYHLWKFLSHFQISKHVKNMVRLERHYSFECRNHVKF